MPRRSVCIVTTTRADYGILRSLIHAVTADPDLELRLLVTGSHLSPEHGSTEREIQSDGVAVWRRVPILVSGGDEQAALNTIGVAILSATPLFAHERPDVVVVVGDRYEVAAFGLAALLLRIPLAHLHGGEVTAGASDEAVRHALTKMATYHFVATQEYAENVAQLGEDPERIFTVGAPGLDELRDVEDMDRDEVFRRVGLAPGRPTALVTFHPSTRVGREDVAKQTEELLGAITRSGLQAVFTGANADANGVLINEKFAAMAAAHPDRYRFRANLGRDLYHGCLRHLDLMVGNSSSGIIEAPSYGLPVVNIGDRQEGRTMAANILSVNCTADAIARAMEKVRGNEFRALCARVVNPYAPYGTGEIGQRIKETLKTVPLGPDVLKKRFRSWSKPHA